MRGRSVAPVAAWLLLVAAVQVVAFVAVWRIFVESVRGQHLDMVALEGNRVGHSQVDGLLDTVLDAVSALSLLAATTVIGFIALARGRVLLAAMATVLIAGANVTTQVLKAGLERPEWEVDAARVGAGNSLPSGHTTVAASVAVALVLVLPPRLRPVAALVGAGYAAVAGVATLSAGWHRPSDAVAAYLVVGAWSAVVGLVLAVGSRRVAAYSPEPHRFMVLTLVTGGTVLLVLAALAMVATSQVVNVPVESVSSTRLLVAYAGGGLGIGAAASLMMALVLSTVHRVVPPLPGTRTSTGTHAQSLAVP